jgi:hypothetical protein
MGWPVVPRDRTVGYGAEPVEGVQTRWPFFPGFPPLSAVREIGLPDRGTVVVLNQLIFLIALAGVWRIARRLPTPAPLASRWSLALFPGAFVFSMVYPSAIWLAVSVWAFILVDERHDQRPPFCHRGGWSGRTASSSGGALFVLRSWRRALLVCAFSDRGRCAVRRVTTGRVTRSCSSRRRRAGPRSP